MARRPRRQGKRECPKRVPARPNENHGVCVSWNEDACPPMQLEWGKEDTWLGWGAEPGWGQIKKIFEGSVNLNSDRGRHQAPSLKICEALVRASHKEEERRLFWPASLHAYPGGRRGKGVRNFYWPHPETPF